MPDPALPFLPIPTRPEASCLAGVLDALDGAIDWPRATDRARPWVVDARQNPAPFWALESLLHEYPISSREGLALMRLAEALLRIPDAETAIALTSDQLGSARFDDGHLASKAIALSRHLLPGQLGQGLLGRLGSRTVVAAAVRAVQLLGRQFVFGQTIKEALANAEASRKKWPNLHYSFDMLGEGARTEGDAKRYLDAYAGAVTAIGGHAPTDPRHADGISIKLSALHPRYEALKRSQCVPELLERVWPLCERAAAGGMNLTIDAEESERLEISLEIIDALAERTRAELPQWRGLGLAVQAYQTRALAVIEHLTALTRRLSQPMMVRLVKGAYWDSEIKRAQVDGLEGYPVYTRKVHTDISYIACAKKLLAAPEAIYPQFATHNAETLATIYHLAGNNYYAGQYEFQCLHGMGEPLYEQVVGAVTAGKLGRPCRIYAPVGTHETLLAYLVRRLLENGANTSFVNRIADETIPLEDLVKSPVEVVDQAAATEGGVGLPHPRIAAPHDLYGPGRSNSHGLDLSNESTLTQLGAVLQSTAGHAWTTAPLLGVDVEPGSTAPVHNPADHRDVVGHVQEATAADVDQALQCARAAAAPWAATPPAERAAALQRAADVLEDRMQPLLGLLMREAGKSCSNAIAEVREAVDFLRYYAAQVESTFDNATHVPLGPVACVSPWNFPLAIFMGQVAAALAAGNPVLAKPAEQTPLIAAEAVRILWRAGVPRGAVQLLPGRGETVGARLIGDARVMGVMFTGSTEVARILQRTIAGRLDAAGRPIPLIAETGGQNAMIVDSSALVEQVVGDAVASAFDSAGQRCSALRVLCVQEDTAGRVVEMLKGAMGELRMGNPGALQVDVGPVIDAEAQAGITAHIDALQAKGHKVFQQCRSDNGETARGTFVPPTLIELNHIGELQREVFGPVLHMVRYAREDLDQLLDQINATGYGLTQGVHTRIDETIARVVDRAHAGNVYVNRNMVGAVVGVQPFGGEGLSGTGPKAGGPLYLLRLLSQRPADALARTFAAADRAAPPDASARARLLAPLNALERWAQAQGHTALAATCRRFAAETLSGTARTLPGPTGERNVYTLAPRATVLCHAAQAGDWLTQLAAVLATGGTALWPASQAAAKAALPAEVQARITLADNAVNDAQVDVAAALHQGSVDSLQALCDALARRPGPIVAVTAWPEGSTDVPLERLLIERALSVNTAAAGGNASLMTIG